MELKIIEDEKNKFVFELIGADHALCTLLKDEMSKDSHVKVSAYRIDHPLLSSPRFMIETEGSTTPKQAITNAAKKLQKTAEKLSKEMTKNL